MEADLAMDQGGTVAAVIAHITSKGKSVPIRVTAGSLDHGALVGLQVLAFCYGCAARTVAQRMADAHAGTGMVGRTGERDTKDAVA